MNDLVCDAFVTAEACRNGMATHGSQNGGPNTLPTMVNQSMAIVPMPAVGAPGGVPGPTTNLNIGMDYWGTATPPALPALHGKASPAPVAGGMVTAGSRESLQSQLWLQVPPSLPPCILFLSAILTSHLIH